MKRSMPACVAMALMCVSILSPDFALGNLITNGNFEDTSGTFPNGWSYSGSNPASAQTGTHAIGGSGTSALVTRTNGYLHQSFTNTNTIAPKWVLEWDFACQDPGGSDDRSMNGSIYRAPGLSGSNVFITYRVNGDGDFQVHDGSWGTPSGLEGAVIFDDDVTELPLEHHVKFVGHMDQPSPTFDLIVTDSNGNTHSALGLTKWKNSSSMGDGLTTVRFDTALMTSGDKYVMDNVSVRAIPEPSALVLLAGAVVGLLGLRRHRVR